MNSSITFPVRPALKLPRNSAADASSAEEKWASKLAEERRRLEEDHEALRVREENLRNYEAHLRSLQEEIEAGRPAPAVTTTGRTASPFGRPSSRSPFDGDAALQTGWEKLHRARELLESEQTHMRHERVIMQDKENDVKRREQSVTERETLVAQRERALAETEAAVESVLPEPIAAEHTMSAMTRLTRAPFDMARSVFSSKK